MTLYETDFHAWTRDQAAVLRRLATERANLPLDLALLAEEVEDMGNSEFFAVRSQVARIVEHLLKLEHSPAREPRGGWMDSVDDARLAIEDRITASLRARLADDLAKAYATARRKAERAMRAHGEASALPAACPYAMESILVAGWYPANRHGIREDGEAGSRD